MAVTNTQSGTNVHEVAAGIYRINTPVAMEGGAGGFSFNQYLIVGDEFRWYARRVASVMPVEKLRYIAFSHVEADDAARSTNG